MNRSYRKLISMAVILLLISGCATTGTAPGSNSGSTDSTQTKAGGAFFGALAGAVLGAGVAAVTGKKDKMAEYALIGGGIGAGLGYIAGQRVAKIKEQYATEEDQLDAEIKLAAQFNQEIRDSNTATVNEINSFDQEISNIASSNCSREEKIDKLEMKKNNTNTMIKKNVDSINNMKTEVDALAGYKQSVEQTQNVQQVGQLEQEITILQTNIAMLDKSNRQMAQMVESLNVRK